MKNNKLIISAAGSGKTTYLVNEALKCSMTENVLITTYTEANKEEIRKKIIEQKKCIPSNITVQTWFSFLLQHGVRPFQGSINELMWDKDVKGMLLSEGASGIKYSFKNDKGITINVTYKEDEDFLNHYFTSNGRIYSDKISKFIVRCDKKSKGAVIDRLSNIYTHLFIDEVQDLAGYDLELIKIFFKSKMRILLVGDPRQVTYLTHQSTKHKKKYGEGRIKEFLQDNCKSLLEDDSIDENTLKKSHRNNQYICNFSSELYPEYEKSEFCECASCTYDNVQHIGVFIVKPEDVSSYFNEFNPLQLRWDKRRKDINPDFSVANFGESKGQTHDRVFIYPTEKMIKWLKDRKLTKDMKGCRAKFYVALTRARHSAAIVYDYNDDEVISGIEKWEPSNKN